MATAAEIQAAYRGIVRADLNATVAASIASSGITLDAYIAGLTAQQASTTGAAVAITSFITGVTPSSTQLDALKVAADAQVASYTKLGVGNPALGAFEAFGRGLATDTTTTATFNTKYGALSTADFITSVYVGVYGTLPSAGAVANLTAQINYFTNLYTTNNVANASLAAKGAVLGQIVGYAFTDANAAAVSTLDNSVATFLSNVAKGDTTSYGKALPVTPGTGTPGSILTLTTAADVIDPAQTAFNLKSTTGDDTIRADDTTLQTTDIINGGAGTDTLNVVLAAALPSVSPVINSVEKINFSGAFAAALDMGSVKGTTDIGTTGATALTVTNATTDVTYTVTNGTGAGAITVTLKDATGTNDTVKLGSTTTASAAAVETFTIAGVENAQIAVSSVKAVDTHGITLASTAGLKTATVSGTGAVTLTAADQTALTTVDAASLNGSLTFAANGTKLTTVNGGTGADAITLTTQTNVKVTGGLGADAIDLGTGSATVIYKAGTESTLTSGADTLTNFATTVDKIDLSAITLTNKTIGTSALASVSGDVDGLFKISGSTFGIVKIGNDYAVDVNNDGNFNAATDLYVKFAAPVTLVTGDFIFGA